ncbi:hypothetical protein [Paenibacillus illinoisensis]|uniref:hypothetical protein n=1 Tax=Paenibacillus illinoisensis TaxID=59845 RepID=UPI002815CC61|nr:hypothetical protein [Paenibacillus illinoisensis]
MTGEFVKASLERALTESAAIQSALKIDTIEVEGDKLEIKQHSLSRNSHPNWLTRIRPLLTGASRTS